MKFTGLLTIVLLHLSFSCAVEETAFEILQNTIAAIDTIETIYFKQEMTRTNPQNLKDTISRYREMYFERLPDDSIVGVKGHWFMYVDDKINVLFEDIFDGKKLVRKNNRDSVTRIYDLEKYPGFRKKHFWSHNTPYAMQYEFKYILDHWVSYSTARLNDTSILGNRCFQILVKLEDKETMPGFLTYLEDSEGSISETLLVIDRETYYPVRMKNVRYTADNPERKMFIDQKYCDINFNLNIDEADYFNTSTESLIGFEIREIQPD